MRVYSSSRGLEAGQLVPGEDLVLDIEPEHGVDLPSGVLADDWLDLAARDEIDRAAVRATTRWIDLQPEALTIDGVCLPWIWEVPTMILVNRLLVEGLGLLRAVEHHRPAAVELVGGESIDRLLVEGVGRVAGVETKASRVEPPAVPVPPAAPLGRRLRRPLLSLARLPGVRSRLRAESTLFVSYWPLLPLLDRMISEPGRRPAVLFDKLPTGPGRALRAALRGGWIGAPGPRDRRHAERALKAAVAGLSEPGDFEVLGVPLGPAVHEGFVRIADARGAGDVAKAAVLRRAMRRRPPTAVVSAWDSEPDARLVIARAREAGVRTFILAHGAYLLEQAAKDMNVGDEIVLWTHQAGPPVEHWDRPVHVIGYPVPHGPPPPTRRYPSQRRPRVGILVQVALVGFAKIDRRIWMRQYETAIRAVRERIPDAQIVLRPHPSEGLGAARVVTERFPGAGLEIDAGSPILDYLESCDLCIGGVTAATLQTALVGTPVIALNLTGFDWRWPLGGDTEVPIARTAEELGAALDRWREEGVLPGREALLEALGADGEDSVGRLLSVLDAAR